MVHQIILLGKRERERGRGERRERERERGRGNHVVSGSSDNTIR